MESFANIAASLRSALTEEQQALLTSTPHNAVLSNGLRTVVKPQRAIYRFEIPDNFYFAPGMSIECTIGTLLQYSFPAVVADIHSQFLYLTFPCDMGEIIPELHCTWNPSEINDILNTRWSSVSSNPIPHNLFNRTFPDNVLPVSRKAIFPSSLTESQRNAVVQSLKRKISIVIGERKRGKTGVAASLLFNALRDGKKILYLASTSESLYHCMNEVISLNPFVIEESIALVDLGLDLQPSLDTQHTTSYGVVDNADKEGLQKLFTVIIAEHEYDRVQQLQQRIVEKRNQIDEATRELEQRKQELSGLLNASMIEKMKKRINKTTIDEAESAVQNSHDRLDRLNRHIVTLTKEEHRIESLLPVPLKEKQQIESFLSKKISFTGGEMVVSAIKDKRCIATTLSQALLLDASILSGFDIVCIDDAHVLNLAEFFYCASLAGEQCYILADVTEQPPQSESQMQLARQWLQKNYFTYFQQADSDDHRFTSEVLPPDVVSQLVLPDETPTIFDACLTAALDGTVPAKGLKGKVYCIDTSDAHATSEQYVGKRKILPFNEGHAQNVIKCIKHALMNGSTTQADIIIVTPPSGQSLAVREHLTAHRCNQVEVATFGSIRMTTKRAMIFDLTVAGIDFTLRMLDDKKFGKVELADALNTMLSTVSEELYVIADLSHFRSRYKGRLLTAVLELFKSVSENTVAISNTARRFDDCDLALQTMILSSSKEEKSNGDYIKKIQQSKPSALNASQSASQQTVAAAEKKHSAEIRSAVLRVLAKRETINLISQFLESYPLYRSTKETYDCYRSLFSITCENENDFKEAMEMWNLLIYETSDAHTSKHPLAEKAKVDAKISKDLKQIHSYYHSELEMVVEEGKHKLAQSIQNIFNDCIGKKPVTPVDWKNAYLVFLTRMEKYLTTIIQQIRL